MSLLVSWFDRRFYPTEDVAWDNKRFRALLLSILKPTDRVLDLGAGRGRIPEMNFKGLVKEVVGLDPDPCIAENPHLDVAIVATTPTTPLPFEDGAFDVVITSNVLEHVSAPVDLFQEVRRVLKPGGVFVNKTPSRTHYVALIAAITPHSFHQWINVRRGRASGDTYPTFYRANSAIAIRKLAESTDFEAVDIQAWEGPPNYMRIVPVAYPLGILYERIVNAFEWLSPLRAVLVPVLRRRGEQR